jgi:uncharacterized protein
MVVGSARVRLYMRQSQSLKDKRQAVRSIKDRIAGMFNVSIAEVDDQDKWQSIVLGIAAVGNEGTHVKSTLQKVVDKIRANPHASLVDFQIEILT